MSSELLRDRIIESFKAQGFLVNGQVEPKNISKNCLRDLHKNSREEQLFIHSKFILDNYRKVKKFIIDGNEIDPSKIELELIEVKENSLEEIIFKWWNLVWWSIPYQRAYGRQMRFILWDRVHNAPFGLIGLQSPILKMAIRDKYLNIPKNDLDIWINKSLQAQRLGALPPYNLLIGGKMTALSLVSKQLREAYKKKYENRRTIIEKRIIESDLLFITTTSAFGKSSIYNRLFYNDQKIAISLGYTKGFGTFHIPEIIYKEITAFLEENGINTSTTFGNGPSRKLKLLDIAFSKLGLEDYSSHNIKREFFFIPLAVNLNKIIHENEPPKYFEIELDDLLHFWKTRWGVPRSLKTTDWKQYCTHKFIENFIINFRNDKSS